jgi:hypothetical protein
MLLLQQAVELAGQKGGGPRRETPVISLLEDRGSVADSTNYRIQSDGLGLYVHSSSKTDPVTSIIQTNNTCCQDWELSTMSSSTRGLLVDFRDPVPGTGANPPVDWQIAGGRVLVQCHIVSSMSFPGMSLGQSLDCPVVVNVDAPSPARTGWRISLGHAGQPGTDSAHVSCVAADASGCSEWTVESTAVYGGELRNVGRLLLARGNEILGSYGDYYFSFSFRVTR